jgi:hypothetical protein
MNDAARPALPAPFQFSQSSLTDFEVCRRRFRLRWIERLEWPAPATTPGAQPSLGQRFHRLMEQHFLGLDIGPLLAGAPADAPPRSWWDAFCRYPPPGLPARAAYPELSLLAPVEGHWLLAELDLLAIDPGERAVIIDWKTGSRPPALEVHAQSWQSCIYPYLLVEAGAPYNGGQPLAPALVEMVYWFAEYPASPLRLTYGDEQHAANARRLRETIALIASLPASAFNMCEDARPCLYCAYQTYCQRGAGLARTDEEDEAPAGDEKWDWADVPEYAY